MTKKRSTLIRGAETQKFEKISFPNFNRRPVNYFRDLIADDNGDSASPVSEAALQSRLADILEADRSENAKKYEQIAEARFRAGLEQGRTEATADVQRAAELLQNYAKVLQSEKQELAERIERSSLNLSFALAGKIIGVELSTKPETVRDIVRNALQQALDCEQVKLRVHPEDLSYLQAVENDYRALFGQKTVLEMRADPAIERGGCMIETERGLLDAQLSTQMETMRQQLGNAMTDTIN